MSKNLFDSVLDGIEEMVSEVTGSLEKEFKGSNPFDKEAMSDEDQLYMFETDGENAFRQIADTQGIEEAVGWTQKMEQIRSKYNG